MPTAIDLLMKLYEDLGGDLSDLETVQEVRSYNTTDGLLYLIGQKLANGVGNASMEDIIAYVGDKEDLTAADKTTIVAAINSNALEISLLNTNQVTLSIYKISNFGTP